MDDDNYNYNRVLATVQTISQLEDLANSDYLSLASVLGWEVIVKRGDYNIGDKIIYCEVDSMIPINADYLSAGMRDFMLTRKVYNVEGVQYHRVKIAKIRGTYSQGLILKLPDNMLDVDINTCVQQELGIIKYETPAFTTKKGKRRREPVKGSSRRTFPSHLLSKTDELRLQSYPKILSDLQGNRYVITLKYDGTSVTYLIDPETDKFLVCSRNFIREDEGDETCPYWNVAYKYNIEGVLRQMKADGYNVAIQGEICGPNIQNNKLKLKTNELYVFNIVRLRTFADECSRDLRLNQTLIELVLTRYNLPGVDVIETGDKFNYNIKELVELSKGDYNSGYPREGIVVRIHDHTVSGKVINPEFLMREK